MLALQASAAFSCSCFASRTELSVLYLKNCLLSSTIHCLSLPVIAGKSEHRLVLILLERVSIISILLKSYLYYCGPDTPYEFFMFMSHRLKYIQDACMRLPFPSCTHTLHLHMDKINCKYRHHCSQPYILYSAKHSRS